MSGKMKLYAALFSHLGLFCEKESSSTCLFKFPSLFSSTHSSLKHVSNRVFPAIESYDVQDWKHVETEAVRTTMHSYLSEGRCAELLEPLREQLAKYPLYITLDKDVMNQTDCIQNWDSGYLSKKEVPTTCFSPPFRRLSLPPYSS